MNRKILGLGIAGVLGLLSASCGMWWALRRLYEYTRKPSYEVWARSLPPSPYMPEELRVTPSVSWSDDPTATPLADIMRLRGTRWAGKWLEGPHIADNIQQDKGVQK